MLGKVLRTMADRFDDKAEFKFEDPKISEALDLFLRIQRSPHTQRAYRSDLFGYLKTVGGKEQKVSDLKALGRLELQASVMTYVNSFAKCHDFSNVPNNGTTLNRKRYTISRFYRFLIDQFGFFFNPASQLPVYPKPSQSTRNRLCEEDILGIMAYLKKRHRYSEADFRNYLIVLGLFHFALRRQELASLRWDSVVEQPVRHFSLRQKGYTIKRLPIPEPYWHLMVQFRETFPSPSPYVFRSTRKRRSSNCDKPIGTNTVFNIVNAVGKALLPHVNLTPHDFRAAFVSIARRYNVDTKTIMNATGHSSAMMIDYYDIRSHLETNAVLFFTPFFEKY